MLAVFFEVTSYTVPVAAAAESLRFNSHFSR